MSIRVGISIALMVVMSATQASEQKHVHDEGELLISQDGNQWQMQFILPAINAFGFEHVPETNTQRNSVNDFLAMINSSEKVILPDGDCAASLISESISDNFLSLATEDDHHHDEHKHEEDEHEHHSHDEHDSHDDHDSHTAHSSHDDDQEHSDAEHANAEFSYLLECKQQIRTVNLPLFGNAHHLQKLSVKWVTESGLGSQTVGAQSPTLSFE